MIVNGIDIKGYDWVKFVRSDVPHHEIEDRDIILYGNNSNDFASLFDIVNSVPITDSEFIDVSPGAISRIGSVSIQSNSVDPVTLDIILTNSESTKVLVSHNSVLLIVNAKDADTIDLGEISDKIKLLNLGKDRTAKLGNIRNARILPRKATIESYYDERVYPLTNAFKVNVGYSRYINKLNSEIMKILPDMTFVMGKRDKTNDKPDSIYCWYDTLNIVHKHFFRKLRRNIMHKLPVNYEFRITNSVKFFKLLYETSNYDFLTNICQLEAIDDDGNPWVFAIHWEISEPDIDLFDPKNGNDTVSASVKAVAQINFFTAIDNYVKGIAKRADQVKHIEVTYKNPKEIAIIDEEDGMIMG